MTIECLSAFDKNPIVSPAKFKLIENGLKNAAYWIKNPYRKSACWKNMIFSYPKRIKLEDARSGKAMCKRRYIVNPDYKRKCVFIENNINRQWEVWFDSEIEMDKWLDSVIVSKKYDMVKKGN